MSGARCLILALICGGLPLSAAAQAVSLTLDDGPMIDSTPLMTPTERNEAILRHLRERGVQAMFFVTIKSGADRPEGLALLRRLSDGGQLIANHTVTHPDFNAETTTLEAFERDVLGCDAIIRELPGYRKLLRFPFLREGAGEAKRDGIRAFLREQGYRIGYVSIDTSDWLVDRKLREALAEHPDLDLTPWREMYLTHVWDDAQAFDRLAKQLYGRAVKHVILLHHRLLNALFLGDVIDMFRARGWTIIPPDEAFADPAYQVAPMIPRVDGGVLETTARALGVPLQPALAGLWSERQVKEEADRLRARP
ncbi:MAG TPA: polysaccharide deacetylase family protein [Vicinamibacteria bacterium]|nr:polysaccharide deacetylase family protein [Vicinamibacteria bacterium]